MFDHGQCQARRVMFDADLPIDDPDKDKLSRAASCIALGDVLYDTRPAGSLTLGIFGPWGSGKTSVLSMIEHQLKTRNTTAGVKGVRIVHFNPWRISDEKQLFLSFFVALRAAVLGDSGWLRKIQLFFERRLPARDDTSVASAEKKVADALGKYALVTGVALGPAVWPIIGSAFLLVRVILAWISGQKQMLGDVDALHDRVSALMAKLPYRVVVFIDDIDRLKAEDIRAMFQLVKSLADFDNISYVLALDWAVVDFSLGPIQGSRGSEYIAKVCQLTWDVPESASEDLNSLLAERISAILPTPTRAVRERFEEIYLSAASGLVRTIRDVNRVVNTFLLRYPLLRDEVDAIDLLGLVILQVLSPQSYEYIKSHKEALSPSPWHLQVQRKADEAAAKDMNEFDDFLATLSSDLREPVRRTVYSLFPRFEGLYTKETYGATVLDRWSAERRVCADDRFSLYFRYTVGKTGVWQKEVTTFLADLSEGKDVAAVVRHFAGDGRDAALVEELRGRVTDISPDASRSLFLILMNLGDSLGRLVPPSRFLVTAQREALSLCEDLFVRVPPGDRADLLLDAVRNDGGDSLAFQCCFLERLEHDIRRTTAANNTPVLSLEVLAEARDILFQKVCDWFRNDRAYQMPHFYDDRDGISLVAFMARYQGSQGMPALMQSLVSNDRFIDYLLLSNSPDNEMQAIADAQFLIKSFGAEAVESRIEIIKPAIATRPVEEGQALQILLEVLHGRTEPRFEDIE